MTDDFLLVYTLTSDGTDERATVVRPHLQHDKETRFIYVSQRLQVYHLL